MSYLELKRAGPWLRVLLVFAMLAVAPPASAFHFPWDQGHDTTQSSDPTAPGPDDRPPCDPCSPGSTHSPVYASLGHAIWSNNDVVLRGRPYMGVYRAYNSNDPVVGLFGNGWSVDFDIALYPATSSGEQQRIYKAANGKRFVYVRQADGSFKAPDSRFETITEGPTTVTMTMLDGRRNVFALDGRLLQRIDTNGNVVSFSHDSQLRPVRIDDGRGRFLTIAYNSASLVSTVTDHSGRNWRYAYDASANLTAVTDPAGGVMRYTWQAYKPPADANIYYQLLSVTDAAGVVQVSFTYSGNQVASYTEGANRLTYTRPTSNTKLAGSVTMRDALNVATSFTYGALGLVTQDVDGIGGRTSYTYDANGLATQTVDASGRIWSSTFDNLGRITSNSNPLGQTSRYEYAADTRPVRLTSPGGRVINLTYDAKGNLSTATDPAGGVTKLSYGPRGDLISVVNALGQATSITYTATGLPLTVVDPLGRTTSMTYDSVGRSAATTNAAGETTLLTYDALDRVLSQTDALGQTTAYTYDAAGRITSLTTAKGAVTRYEYDTFGRRTAEVAPDGRRTTFAYRADNRLSQLTWPDATTITYAYDNSKRLIRETAGSEVITRSYNAVNQLTGATGPGGSVGYAYDAAGRVIEETSGGRTQSITRNADGERVRLDYLSQSLSYTRDARGLVTRIAAPAGNFDFDLDTLGRRTRLAYPNGSVAQYAFDAGDQMTALTHTGALNATYRYGFDLGGRIIQISGDGADWNYTYDASGRLKRAAQGAAVTPYTLDSVGNMLDGGRTHDVNNRLLSDANRVYSYDARGNLTLERDRTSGARVAYTWNVKNQLLRVDHFSDAASTTPSRTLQFTYDPLGRRASKIDNGVTKRYVYDGDDIVATLDGASNVTETNVFSGEIDEPLSSTFGGSTKMLLANHIGSIVAVAEGNTVTHTYSYGPFGETLLGSSADSTPFRFAGREKDTETLYFNRARYYSTSTRAFLSPDPIGSNGGVNLYQYAGGNPVSYKDPTGMQRGSPEWCRRQAERIRNIRNKIQERLGELDENPQNLPEACPGDDVSPSLSRRGHRKLINIDKANLAAQEALYAAHCGGGGPPPVPVPVPAPAPQPVPSSGDNTALYVATGVVVVIGIGALIFFTGGAGAAAIPAFASDRRRKTRIEDVDHQAVLKQLMSVPVSAWSYSFERDGTRHIGPMAQDFYRAFDVGARDTEIAVVDANGVLIASVQALKHELDRKSQQVDALQQQLDTCMAKLDALLARERPNAGEEAAPDGT